MSFFVIIVVIPYLVALVAFVKPGILDRYVHAWPWETRRAELGGRDAGTVEGADEAHPP